MATTEDNDQGEEDRQHSKALEAAKGWLAAERRQLQEAAFMPHSGSETREAGGQQPTPLAGRYAETFSRPDRGQRR